MRRRLAFGWRGDLHHLLGFVRQSGFASHPHGRRSRLPHHRRSTALITTWGRVPMSVVPRTAVPTLIKGLTRLNDEGQILVDRDALAMLAAVDGRASVEDIARVHGLNRTNDGLTKLLLLGAVRLEVRTPPI